MCTHYIIKMLAFHHDKHMPGLYAHPMKTRKCVVYKEKTVITERSDLILLFLIENDKYLQEQWYHVGPNNLHFHPKLVALY